MKQNERLLVYAVTGFLAVILVIAVLFGSDPSGDAGKDEGAPRDLNSILGGDTEGGKTAGGGGDGKTAGSANVGEDGTRSGLARPSDATGEQPLVAKPQLAADLVARVLGVSRRDRNVRFVRAKRGDSLESLVRRWCGARDPYLEEARCLNEELVVVKVGQEVAVPWIDDEQLVALIEERQPRTLLAEAGVIPSAGGAVPAIANGGGSPSGIAPSGSAPSGVGPGPDFRLPGAGEPTSAGSAPTVGSAAAVATHTVVAGDALWTIAANRYGAGKATRMVAAIKRLNPGLDEHRLKIGQKIKLPPASE